MRNQIIWYTQNHLNETRTFPCYNLQVLPFLFVTHPSRPPCIAICTTALGQFHTDCLIIDVLYCIVLYSFLDFLQQLIHCVLIYR